MTYFLSIPKNWLGRHLLHHLSIVFWKWCCCWPDLLLHHFVLGVYLSFFILNILLDGFVHLATSTLSSSIIRDSNSSSVSLKLYSSNLFNNFYSKSTIPLLCNSFSFFWNFFPLKSFIVVAPSINTTHTLPLSSIL